MKVADTGNRGAKADDEGGRAESEDVKAQNGGQRLILVDTATNDMHRLFLAFRTRTRTHTHKMHDALCMRYL